jgi:signal transduction histidine kinase
VLSNLVGNAVKFAPESGRILVSARHESVAATDPEAPPIPASQIGAWTPTDPTDDSALEFVRVDVSDNGPGMSPEVRARVFEKFAQAEGKARTKGVGLGLYISREIILRHGGTIFVESEVGKGTTFSFRIPVA